MVKVLRCGSGVKAVLSDVRDRGVHRAARTRMMMEEGDGGG